MLPLNGYRIVDFGTALVGGLSGRFLAELGAEVIKVESRARLDGFRRGRPMMGTEAARADEAAWPELQRSMQNANRDKLSITLNMNKPEGLDLIKRLIGHSDATINNFSAGVLKRRGLDYESLRAIKPDIIMVSMPGTGDTGPLRDYATYAFTAGALSGAGAVAGWEDGRLVGTPPGAWADVVNAISGALAVVAAFQHRDLTGEGQYVESSQLEASAALLGASYLEYVMNERVPQPHGNAHPMMAPHDSYPAQDGRWVAIAVRTDQEWNAFCRATGHEEWTRDPRFQDLAARLKHRSELNQLIAEWTRGQSSDEIVTSLQQEGVAATPFLQGNDRARDEYFMERGAFIETEHPYIGKMLLPGLATRLFDGPITARHAPILGEHNDYVLGEILGLSAEDRSRLVEEEVVY